MKRLSNWFRRGPKQMPIERRPRFRPRLETLEERIVLTGNVRDLLIADPSTESILRFDGETGAAKGAFVASGAGGLVDPHNPTFGPDGQLYVMSQATGAAKILRYDGASGDFLGTFVNTGSGGFAGGFGMTFGPNGDLYVATGGANVLRYNGTTGAFVGVAATGNGIQRASGVEFGPDGNVYVLDSDSAIDTAYDRILRFNPDTAAFIDVFVQPGSLEDAITLTFGPDGNIYVPDYKFQQTLRFSGATGKLVGAFQTSSQAAGSFGFDVVFGPDGNAYYPAAQSVLRYEGETGQFHDEFVDGPAGTIVFFPPNGPAADLSVSNIQIPAGVVQGNDLSVTYTVTNTSANPTDVDAWADVVYLSTDNVFDPSDTEVGRISRTSALAAGASYTETVTAASSGVSLGQYYVFVIADRRGVVNDAHRLNNFEASVQTLQVAPPLASSHDPDHSIIVGRALSAYTAADIANGSLTITYTVYNETDGYAQGVLLTTTLGLGVTFTSASKLPDRNGQQLAWSLGTLAPYERTSVAVTVALASSSTLQIDSGAKSFAMLDTVAVSDSAPAAALVNRTIPADLLASTADANTTDPFVQEQAAKLNYDPQTIFEFLNNDVGYDSYVGSLRGARGTLWSAAGNSLDEASLGVALFRASGIPARYAHGTLSDSLSQQLILSMFPASFQTVGYIPAGTAVADPANNPQLLAETRDHFWLQVDMGSGFVNADTSGLPGGDFGTAFTSVVETFSEVADGLRHKVQVKLEAEMYSVASAAFSFAGGLSTTTVLDQTFNAVDLVGRPVTIGQFVATSRIGALVFTSTTNTYSPYVMLGDIAVPPDAADIIRGVDIQEVLTNFPFGTKFLTGYFSEIGLLSPSGTTETFRRTIIDRIGYASRQTGESSQSFDPNGPLAFSSSDFVTLNVLPGLIDKRQPVAVAQRVQDLQSRLKVGTSGLPETNNLTRQFYIGLSQAMLTAFTAASDARTANIAQATGTTAYFDTPRITIYTTKVDSAGHKVIHGFDLLRDGIRVLAQPGQTADAVYAFRMTRGLSENLIEDGAIRIVHGTDTVSMVQILEAADAQGIPIIFLTSRDIATVTSQAYSSDAKARMTAALQQGKVLIVPAGMVDLGGGVRTVGWYELNPISGELIDVLENGTHVAQSGSEYGAVSNVGPTAAAGVIIVDESEALAVYEAEQATLAAIARWKALKAYAIKYGKPIADLPPFPVLFIPDHQIQVATGVFVAFLKVTFGILALVDPPLPTFQSNLKLPFPAVLGQTAAAEKSVAASAPVGTVIGSVSIPTFTVRNRIAATWAGEGVAGFQTSTLDIPIANIRDTDGNVVGTGAVSLVAEVPVSVSVTGTVEYAIDGVGSMSFYSPATSGAAIAAEWDGYTAHVNGAASLVLKTGGLSLNGVRLPAGTYTMTTSAATLTGVGRTASATFAGSASISVTNGNVHLGHGSGSLSVGGSPLNPGVDTMIAGYTGTLNIIAGVADSDPDAVQLNGSAANVLQVTAPSGLGTNQNASVAFQASVNTSFADTYSLSVEAPEGWTVKIDASGNITATPAPGCAPGSYPIRIIAISNTNPELVAQTIVDIAVAATSPGLEFQVASDPLFTVPYLGAQVPSAYRSTLRNLGPVADTYNLTFENLPLSFSVLNSRTQVTVPAGETGILGLYLEPTGSLPAPGTVITFDVTATSVTIPSITQTRTIKFTVPEIRAVSASGNPAPLTAVPGLTANANLDLHAVGNVDESVDLSLTASNGVTVTGLPATVSLTHGQNFSIPLSVSVATSVPLNSNLSISILVKFGSNPDVEQTMVIIPVRVVVPGADSIAAASLAASQLGDLDLSNRLSDLSIALTNLVQHPADPVFKGQSLDSLDSILTLLAVDPVLVGFVAPLSAARENLVDSQGAPQTQAAVITLGSALGDFEVGIVALVHHFVEVSLLPNSLVAQPGVPQNLGILLHNAGDQTTTYDLTLLGLPADVTGSVSQTSVTLDPGQYSSGLFVTLSQTSGTDLQAFEFQVNATASGFPTVSKSALGTMQARAETVSVVSVAATPPFADAGGVIAVSARVLNAVNRQQDALASYTVRDPNGALVFTSTNVPFALTVVTSLTTVPLGTFDTTGFANGQYTVTVTIADASGTPIPGAFNDGSVLIGSPVAASIAVGPEIVAPGTSIVTNTLVIGNQSRDLDPPSIVGQTAVAGANDAIRNGDYVYVASKASGISVFNIAGANINNPQLVRVVGTSAEILRIRGNLLVSVRGGNDGPNVPNSTRLETYSLTDPANPQLLGTTGELPFSAAADVMLTDTHAFIVHINLHSFFGFTIFSQTGSVIAVNIANPAAPFFDGDAISAQGTPAGHDGVNDGILFNDYGTNTDGIWSNGVVDESGGARTTWSITQVSPTIAYVTGSTSTGGDTQAGVGVVHVVDISDPRNMRVIRDLQIPGTVHVVAINVVGNRAFMTASTGGWRQNSFDSRFTGNSVLASLDLTDPANPQIIRSQILAEPALGIGRSRIVSLGNGLFAYNNQGAAETDPGLFVFDGNDPNNLRFIGLDVPAEIFGMYASGNLLFTADRSSLIIYQVNSLPIVPVHAEVQIPKNTGVALVPGSFNIAPTQIISGTDFDTLDFDQDLTVNQPTVTINWQSTVTGLAPGEARPVTLGTTVSFTSQGEPGQVSLPATKIVAKQILAISPDTQSVRPGESATYVVTITNPATTAAAYDLSLQGIPQEWADFAPQVTVAAGASVDVPFTLTSDPFAPLADYGFIISATRDGVAGSVQATLVLSGAPLLPQAEPESHGVVLALTPTQATAGQGTPATYVVRVTNTGSAVETYALSLGDSLPAGFVGTLGQTSVVVPPGASNFRDVQVSVLPPAGTAPALYEFSIAATSTSSTGAAQGAVQVVAQGVTASLSPSAIAPGGTLQFTVTNSGSATDTFDLTVGGPAGLVATLALNSVTLAAGASQTVDIATGPIDFALAGFLNLTATATSRTNTAVRAGAAANLTIPTTQGLTGSFTPNSKTLSAPGDASFLLLVKNTGNTEDSYTVTITGANGPIAASLIGLDGQPTQSIPIFRLPGLSSGAILLKTTLTAAQLATVNVKVTSLTNEQMSSSATATLNAGTAEPLSIGGTVYFDYNADGVFGAEPGLAGRTVYLDIDNNGQLGSGDVSTFTDANGAYLFPNLLAGASYTVRLDVPFNNLVQTGPTGNTYVVSLSESNVTGRDFGAVIFSPVAPVPISKDLYTPPVSPTADAAAIQGLYHTLLARPGETDGVAYWLGQLASGQTLAQVALRISVSAEHRLRQVNAYYQSFLHREADDAGRDSWVKLFLAGQDEAAVVEGFLNSREYQNAHASDSSFVAGLYGDVLGRRPSDAELSVQVAALAGGTSRARLAHLFVHSNESNQLAVAGFYAAYLHRPTDPISSEWVNELVAGVSLARVAANMLGEPTVREFYINGKATVR